ncbi:MAG: GNAT family N-acetyltransferase [Sediminicola sp.]
MHDLHRLIALTKQIYPPSYGHLWKDKGENYLNQNYNYGNLNKELSEAHSHYYFIEHRSVIAGILRLQHNRPPYDLPKLQATKLHRLYLAPYLQGKGIGQALMDWTVGQSLENKSSVLWLEAMDTQAQALKFYQKNGFTISGRFNLELDFIHGSLKGMFRMQKELL